MAPTDRVLVALTPSELPQAQSALVAWCDEKIAALQAVVEDLYQNLVIARRNLWRTSALQAAYRREERRVIYYSNIKAALQAGYLIIPNFPIDVLAVRVRPDDARRKSSTYLSDRLLNTQAESLPVGEGAYVDDRRPYVDHRVQRQDAQGKTITTGEVVVEHYNETVDLPLVAMKPAVLSATERALALKIFDKIGLVRQRRGDPILVGQCCDPRERWPESNSAKRVTFFIAWWLNTADL